MNKLLISAAAVAVALTTATSASAARVTYEAENFASATGLTSIVNSSTTSGGKYVKMQNNGTLTINVPTDKVYSFAFKVKSESCLRPGDSGNGEALYGYAATPSYYWQEDAWMSGQFGLPGPQIAPAAFTSPSKTAYVEGNTAGDQTHYWSAPGFTHPDPHKIGVTFTNDYVRNENGVRVCDRNLLVDKLIVDTTPFGN